MESIFFISLSNTVLTALSSETYRLPALQYSSHLIIHLILIYPFNCHFVLNIVQTSQIMLLIAKFYHSGLLSQPLAPLFQLNGWQSLTIDVLLFYIWAQSATLYFSNNQLNRLQFACLFTLYSRLFCIVCANFW